MSDDIGWPELDRLCVDQAKDWTGQLDAPHDTGRLGTSDVLFEDVINGFDILIGAYVANGLIAEYGANAALQQLSAYSEAHDAKFDSAGFEALRTTDTWKDKLFPNRQHRAALSVGSKLCP